MRYLWIASLLAASCSGTYEPLTQHPHGYAERMEAADLHSRSAAVHRAAATSSASGELSGYQCGDVALSDEATSGGQRINPSIPCWDLTEETAAHERFLADRDEDTARQERHAAAGLVEAELTACKGLSPRELEHSPFDHRREIAEVVPHRERGVLRGVRVIWKPVPGLSAAWMRQAIACHRARFERMGEPATYFPEDPTLVAGATVTVQQRGGHLDVLIATPDDTSGHVAVGRAEDLVHPRTADR